MPAPRLRVGLTTRVGYAIGEACAALRLLAPTIRISRDSHYQLSNRVAFAWKLATLGLPTVLVYLGFCGDDGITDVGEPLLSDAHWRSVLLAHARSIVPENVFERRLDCGAAPAWLLVRSRPVLEPSGPPDRPEPAPHSQEPATD